MEKDDLLKEIWPDTFVEEANLTQNIFTLRRALGDERAGPRYIETVTRRGYRFIAPVRTIVVDENEVAKVYCAIDENRFISVIDAACMILQSWWQVRKLAKHRGT